MMTRQRLVVLAIVVPAVAFLAVRFIHAAGTRARAMRSEACRALNPQTMVAAKVKSGQEAPDFTLKDTTGRSWTLSALRGRPVLLNFWATWCAPCRKSIPELNAYSKKFKDKLVVVGLSNETEQAVRQMKDPQIEYAMAIDTEARTLREIGVRAIPHLLLIDPKGIVRYQGHPGAINESVLQLIFEQFADK